MGADGYLFELCRFYVFVTLAIAVLGKSLATGPFITSVANLLGMTRRNARFVAISLIGAEAVIAMLLVWGGDPAKAGMVAALLLFVAFTTTLAVALARRQTVRCNCFGGRGHIVSFHDLARNATLMAAAGGFLAAPKPKIGPEIAELALLLAGALILFLVSAHSREIQALAKSNDAPG